MSLCLDPGGRVGVPLVLAVRKRPEARFDVLPALVVLERATNGLGDEGAAPSPSHASVEPLHEIVVQCYVQTHGHTLTHCLGHEADVHYVPVGRIALIRHGVVRATRDVDAIRGSRTGSGGEPG